MSELNIDVKYGAITVFRFVSLYGEEERAAAMFAGAALCQDAGSVEYAYLAECRDLCEWLYRAER